MAVAACPFVPKDGTLLINDGATPTPLALTIAYEDGDLKVGPLMKGQMQVQEFRSRGATYAVRETEDTTIEISFTCHAVGIVGDGTTALPGDAILKQDVWASAKSTLPTANGDAHCLKLTWTGERSDFGAAADTVAIMKYVNMQMEFSEGIPGKLSITGKLFCISNDYFSITGQ